MSFSLNFNLYFQLQLLSILFGIHFRCAVWWLDNHTLYTVYFQDLAPCVVIAILLLTTFPILYLTSHDYSVTTDLYFSISSSFLTSPPPGSIAPKSNISAYIPLARTSPPLRHGYVGTLSHALHRRGPML